MHMFNILWWHMLCIKSGFLFVGFLHQLCSMIKPFFKICVSYIAIYHMYDWPWLQGHCSTPSRTCNSSQQSDTPARRHSCGPSSMCVETDYIKIDSVTDAAIWIVLLILKSLELNMFHRWCVYHLEFFCAKSKILLHIITFVSGAACT